MPIPTKRRVAIRPRTPSITPTTFARSLGLTTNPQVAHGRILTTSESACPASGRVHRRLAERAASLRGVHWHRRLPPRPSPRPQDAPGAASHSLGTNPRTKNARPSSVTRSPMRRSVICRRVLSRPGFACPTGLLLAGLAKTFQLMIYERHPPECRKGGAVPDGPAHQWIPMPRPSYDVVPCAGFVSGPSPTAAPNEHALSAVSGANCRPPNPALRAMTRPGR